MADKRTGQPFSFGIADSALAEAGGTTLDALHFDVDAICRAYEAIEPVARRFGIPAPKPRLAGFCSSLQTTHGRPAAAEARTHLRVC